MKILHTADWHLGKYLKGASRHSEQIEVLQEICEIVEKEGADVVLIAGDLYDTYNPPTESVELLYKTLKRLTNNGKRPVIAIAGNHDSADRIEAPEPLARECGIIFAGYPSSRSELLELETGLKIVQCDVGFIEVCIPASSEKLRVILAPYANEYRLKKDLGDSSKGKNLREMMETQWKELSEKYCDPEGINILMAHLFFMKEGGVRPDELLEEEKPALNVGGASTMFSRCIPSGIQYVALGHIHRQQEIDSDPCPVVYSGSPLSYSYAEENQAKYVMVVDAQAGKAVQCRRILLTKGKKLLRASFEDIDEAVGWLEKNLDCWVEITIVTDKYLDAGIKKRLHRTHPFITDIIPVILNSDASGNNGSIFIDPNKGMDELFIEYFKREHKQKEPTPSILHLFKECLS